MERRNLTVMIFAITVIIASGWYFFLRKNDKLEHYVITMRGMHISLDFNNALTKYDGQDSLFKSEDKIKEVIFVDSLSCTSCFVSHIADYYPLNDTLIKYGGSLIIVLHPQQLRMEEVKSQLETEKFPFWCVLDVGGEFVKNNPRIPDNKLLHSFTLNRDNSITLVGDPLRNKKLISLLVNTLKYTDKYNSNY